MSKTQSSPTARRNLPRAVRWAIFLGVTVGALVGLLALPAPWSTLAFVLLALGSALVARMARAHRVALRLPRGYTVPRAVRWAIFLGVTVGALVGLLILPAPWSTLAFVLLALGSVVAARRTRKPHVTAVPRAASGDAVGPRSVFRTVTSLPVRAGLLIALIGAAAVIAVVIVLRALAGFAGEWAAHRRLAPVRRVLRGVGRSVPALGTAVFLRLRDPGPRRDAVEVAHTQRRVRAWWVLLEIAVLVASSLLATHEFGNLNEARKVYGGEGEWLTSSAQFAALSLRRYHYLPLWQPYLESGEPLIESPFSFVLNPFSVGPSLLLGGVNGIKFAVIVTALLAALGGWTLGRVLGLGSLGRVVLGLLMLGKGNMVGMIGSGYFQLGVTQAYFPWIIAGMLAVLRYKRRRWPPVLLALSFTLMFFGGNIWYTLPMLLSLLALTAAYTLHPRARRIDWAALRRAAFAAVLTVGLSAVLLLPVWLNRDRIGDHPDDRTGGFPADPIKVIEQFYNGSKDVYLRGGAPGQLQFYYSYTSPAWFLLLIFVAVPFARPFRYRSMARLWGVALLLGGVCLLWGMGGHPIMRWVYQHVPGLGQWRFVGRALAVTSFWLAVLIAVRVDALWCQINRARWWRGRRFFVRWPVRGVQVSATLLLSVASLAAARDVVRHWTDFAGLSDADRLDTPCLIWLRDHFPDDPALAVYRYNYEVVTPFLDEGVRLANIEADYRPIPLPSTQGNFDWTALLPRYGLTWDENIRQFLYDNGYTMIADSPDSFNNGYPCLYVKDDAFPYAFTVSQAVLWEVEGANLGSDRVQPVDVYRRLPDRLTLVVQAGTEPLVLTVQERAFPGWQVTVDGRRAKLESVGGLIGVVLPEDGDWHTVRFRYRPPLFFLGSVITLVTAALVTLYLLRAEGLWRRRKAR